MLIGELAKATGTTKDTIRHYDQMGLLISTERQAGSRSYKDYSQDNIERLDMIRLAINHLPLISFVANAESKSNYSTLRKKCLSTVN